MAWFIYLLLMSRPSIIVHCELKIFLWVQSAKVSPLTHLGLFFLLQGSQGWKLPVSQRGALKPRWHRRGGRSLLSCELYGLKSGCQSAVIAQWEWAPPLGQSASQRTAINKLSTLSPKPVRLEPQGARSLNFPKHCPLLFFFHLLFMFAEICWSSCHTSLVLLSVWKWSGLILLSYHFCPARMCLCPLSYQAYMHRHPLVPAIKPVLTSSDSIGYFGESRMM